MSGETDPDQREDPRGKFDTGQGYPEEEPSGANDQQPDGTEHGPEEGTGDTKRAPETDGSGRDSPPSTATGNPFAAGG